MPLTGNVSSARPIVHQLGALPCSMVNSLTRNTEEQCKFMIDNDCLEDEAAIDYVYLVFCDISYEMRHLAVTLIASLVVILFLNLSAVADEFLCPSLLTVAKNLRMSDSLAGVTLLAFGNGCPDIFASLAAASSGRPELIVGELLGAGIFCTSIVAGLIFINNDFKVARRPLLRDTSFYLLAVYLIWLYCRQGRVTFYGSIAFIVIYVIYLFIALSGQAIHSRMRGEYPLAEGAQQNEKGAPGAPCAARAISKQAQEATSGASAIAPVPACLAATTSERRDNYESWFAWRDESGRRRSSVKKEQIELARREVTRPPPLPSSLDLIASGGGGGLGGQQQQQQDQGTFATKPTLRHHHHHQHQQQQQRQQQQTDTENKVKALAGGAPIYQRADGKSTTIVELAQGPARDKVTDFCSHHAEHRPPPIGPAAGPAGKPVDGALELTSGDQNKIKLAVCQVIEPSAAPGALPGDKKEKVSGSASNSFTLSELDDFLFHINPINSIVWSESRLLVKIMSVLRAPILFVTILTVPVVDYERRNNNWCRLLNSIHCFLVPGAIILLTRLGDDKDDVPGRGNLVGSANNHSLPAGWPAATPHPHLDLSTASGTLAGAAAATAAVAAAVAATNHSNPSQLLDHTVATSSLTHQLDSGFESLQLILLLAPGFLLSLFVFYTTKPREAPKYHVVFAYFGFGMSVTWIYVLATEIVSLLKTIGIIFSMTDTAIGLSVLAWGNSLGDIVANLTLAEAGYARMALGASIGAPLLNLLLGFGLSFSYSLKPGGWAAIEYGPTTTLLASTLTLVLLLLMLSTLMPASWLSKKPLGYLLITCYGLYFSLAVCLESGVLGALS